MVLAQVYYSCGGGIKLNLYSTLYRKINSNLTKDLHIKGRIIKLLVDNKIVFYSFRIG